MVQLWQAAGDPDLVSPSQGSPSAVASAPSRAVPPFPASSDCLRWESIVGVWWTVRKTCPLSWSCQHFSAQQELQESKRSLELSLLQPHPITLLSRV